MSARFYLLRVCWAYIAIEHGVVCYFILSTEKTVFRKIKIENFVRLRKMLIC